MTRQLKNMMRKVCFAIALFAITGFIVQLVEQLALNQRARGLSPSGVT